MRTCHAKVAIKLVYVGTQFYRKIPSVKPGFMFVQCRGLFSEEAYSLIIGGDYAFQNWVDLTIKAVASPHVRRSGSRAFVCFTQFTVPEKNTRIVLQSVIKTAGNTKLKTEIANFHGVDKVNSPR